MSPVTIGCKYIQGVSKRMQLTTLLLTIHADIYFPEFCVYCILGSVIYCLFATLFAYICAYLLLLLLAYISLPIMCIL